MAAPVDRPTTATSWLPRRGWIVALSLWAVLVGILVIVGSTPQGERWNDDVSLYRTAALAMAQGNLDATTAVPLYPPFLSTYPPLSLIPMALPLVFSNNLPGYTFVFGLEMCLLAGLGVLLVAPVARRLRHVQIGVGPFEVYAAFALLSGSVIALRWDIVPSILVLGALAAASGGFAALAGTLLGIGAAVKLFPAVAVPVLIGWYWYRNDRRGAWQATAGFAAAAVIGAGLFWLFPGASPLDLLRAQAGRGLELETLLGSVIGVLASLGILSGTEVEYANGSFNLIGPGVGGALSATGLLEPAALLLAYAVMAVRLHRDRNAGVLEAQHLVHGMALVMVVLLLTNRVFSPQYIVWLLPFAPFLGRPQQWVALLAAALTMLIFPFLYEPLLSGSAAAAALLFARNVALLLLLAMLAGDLLTGRIPRHSPRDPDQEPPVSASAAPA